MDRRRFLLISVAGAIAAPLATTAEQAEKVHRLGISGSGRAVTRVAVLHDPTTSPTVLKEIENTGRRLKVQLQIIEARVPEDLEGVFRTAAEGRAAAVSILASPFFQSQQIRLGKLAIEHRLPTMVPHRE